MMSHSLKHNKKLVYGVYFIMINSMCICEEQRPKGIDVGIMCSVDGITARMKFDQAFNGKIYSSKYIMVHNCVYYNTHGDENTILFSIPNYNCGTVVEKDNQNLISHIENEVYVQFERDMQNINDRRYLFVCDRDKAKIPYNANTGPQDPDVSGSRRETLHPVQTIIVETISPTRLTATNKGLIEDDNFNNNDFHNQQQPLVWMEIRDGNSPGRPETLKKPLKLGDPLILVVSGRSKKSDFTYDVFAHSCFASDGSGLNRVELTDSSGCNLRPNVAQSVTRHKTSAGVISYSLPFKAFKFPTSNDVYFSCSVDICSSCDFKDLCSDNQTFQFERSPRDLHHNRSTVVVNTPDKVLSVYDSIKIYEPDFNEFNIRKPACFSTAGLSLLMTSFLFLSLALICTIIWIIHLHKKNKK